MAGIVQRAAIAGRHGPRREQLRIAPWGMERAQKRRVVVARRGVDGKSCLRCRRNRLSCGRQLRFKLNLVHRHQSKCNLVRQHQSKRVRKLLAITPSPARGLSHPRLLMPRRVHVLRRQLSKGRMDSLTVMPPRDINHCMLAGILKISHPQRRRRRPSHWRNHRRVLLPAFLHTSSATPLLTNL